ncbi:MAG: conjugal transfer protein TraX [Lachnospiraceae bacterium]|nr:conjugal transfer protein TraX [Lachnospiraceae bacterium]
MIRPSKGKRNKKPGQPEKTLTAKLFHNLCQVDPQGSAWHPPFYGGVSPLSFSANVLKWIAVVTMLLDHVAASFLKFYFRAYGKTAALDTLYNVLRDIGRIAFPIYIFLLVEGLAHTKSCAKYLLRLGIFAILSEIPYDLAFYGVLWYPKKQNVFFTMLIGLAVIRGMDSIGQTLARMSSAPSKKRGSKAEAEETAVLSPVKALIFKALLYAGLIAAGCLLAELLKTDYHAPGVLAICVMYLFRRRPWIGMILLVLPLLITSTREFYALAAVIPVSLYNGKRGRQAKYFFYAFYPVHLFLLYLIVYLFISR